MSRAWAVIAGPVVRAGSHECLRRGAFRTSAEAAKTYNQFNRGKAVSSLQREQVETALRNRLDDAERRWRAGKGYTLHAGTASGEASADSRYATAHAVREYRRALAAYAQALREWADFTLDGKVPGWISKTQSGAWRPNRRERWG